MVVIIKIHLLKRASVRVSFFVVPYVPKIIRDWKEVIEGESNAWLKNDVGVYQLPCLEVEYRRRI